MDRSWLLTWTTYGTWLSGDARGFVSNVAGDEDKGVRHNLPGTPCDAGQPALERFMRQQLRGGPVYLTSEHAGELIPQFQETAAYRSWLLLAAAVMANHVHLVVGVDGDPEPESLLRDFKSYGSRRLNAGWGKPPSGTWWTESGSKRKIRDLAEAVQYVRDQPYALRIWIHEDNAASGGRQPPVPVATNRARTGG